VAGLVWFLFSAGGAVTCLSAAAVWVLVSRSRSSRRTLLAVALFYLAASAYVVPHTVWRLMVAGYAPLTREAVPPGRVAVVLLGSGSYQVRDWAGTHFAVVDRIAAARLLEAARLFRLLDADYVVSSGGLIRPSERLRASGLTMAEALAGMGVPRDRIVVEDASMTTHHEAQLVKGILASRPVDHVVLVTSQIHMRRSAGAFRAEGIEVIPGVAREPASIDTGLELLIPTDKGLEESAMVAHELFGLVYYAARGWYRP
jgi:uncharacterized SAM-binding protein YcdF (DUF218 family)